MIGQRVGIVRVRAVDEGAEAPISHRRFHQRPFSGRPLQRILRWYGRKRMDRSRTDEETGQCGPEECDSSDRGE